MANGVPQIGYTTDPAFVKIITDNPVLFSGWREATADSRMDDIPRHYLNFTTEGLRQAKEAIMEAHEAEEAAWAKLLDAEKEQEVVGRTVEVAGNMKELANNNLERVKMQEVSAASLLLEARGTEEDVWKRMVLARVAFVAARDRKVEVLGKYTPKD
ncbi:uncharacterized protein N0V89_000102 [Didymosphaeria variabile]|uniref:Uncharacterized protein n=1 Tax=Didymosphaeria variabile TaxID=1932322 RepID=A0A9W8XW58_9PLEO|nr:uncharacterized protein N0V89_000102 [Didymosphaeria variabile]KAJ4359547.1 hypothetical protein N0V89_000102 [Didymosphaeria variabile]